MSDPNIVAQLAAISHVPTPGKSKIQDDWERAFAPRYGGVEFLRALCIEIYARLDELRAAGDPDPEIGIAVAIENVRHGFVLARGSTKLNRTPVSNAHRAFFSRLLMDLEPDLRGPDPRNPYKDGCITTSEQDFGNEYVTDLAAVRCQGWTMMGRKGWATASLHQDALSNAILALPISALPRDVQKIVVRHPDGTEHIDFGHLDAAAVFFAGISDKGWYVQSNPVLTNTRVRIVSTTGNGVHTIAPTQAEALARAWLVIAK